MRSCGCGQMYGQINGPVYGAVDTAPIKTAIIAISVVTVGSIALMFAMGARKKAS